MKKRMLAWVLCLLMALTVVPTGVFAAQQKKPNYGSSYGHIDVKTDAVYTVKVDGVPHSLTGYIDPQSITVKVGSSVYDFEDYTVRTQSEGGHYEYNISFGRGKYIDPDDIAWVENTFKMSNVYVSARIYFSSLPDELKPLFSSDSKGFYADITDYQYDGVNECTGGRGMRSEGHTGTPSGLDLYINATGLSLYITSGKLAVEKVIVDGSGEVLDDAEAFDFTLKDAAGNTLGFDAGNGYVASGGNTVISVKGGETVVLENLPVGVYTITEIQKDGYVILDANGNVGDNYSKDYTVEAKNDDEIPVVVFTNRKLSGRAALSIAKTVSGETEGYSDPTVSIYSADAAGEKSGEAIWSGTVPSGDRLYLNVLLSAGTYVVEETNAAKDGYSYAPVLTAVNASVSGMLFTVSEDSLEKTVALTLDNEYALKPTTGSLSISKTFGNESALDADDIDSISVSIRDGVGYSKTVTLNAANDWSATVDGLVPGYYKISETGAERDGYTLTVLFGGLENDGVTVAAGETAKVVIENTYVKNTGAATVHDSVTVTKVDGNSQKLDGAEFEIVDADGSVIDTFAAGEKVISTSDRCFAGILPKAGESITLTLIEKKAPLGYSKAESGWTITISADAEESLKDDVFITTTTYTIFVENGKSISVVNKQKTGEAVIDGSATVDKVDGEGNRLEGAVFEIVDGNGLPLGSFTAGQKVLSTADGMFDGLLPTVDGESAVFTLREVSAPEGYGASSDSWEIVISVEVGTAVYDEAQDAFITTSIYRLTIEGKDGVSVVNEKKTEEAVVDGSFTVVKTDGEDVIEGAEFGIFESEDAAEPIMTFTAGTAVVGTDEEALLDFLPEAGEFVTLFLKEIAAPEGYAAVDTVWEIRIEAKAETALENGVFVTSNVYTVTVDGAESLTVENSRIVVPETVDISVRKVWVGSDDAERPESVTVELFCDGDSFDKVVLSEENGWEYTWTGLEADHEWTVDEPEVPEGYRKTVSSDGNDFTVTNTEIDDPYTGYSGNIALWGWLMLASGAIVGGLSAFVFVKRRKA